MKLLLKDVLNRFWPFFLFLFIFIFIFYKVFFSQLFPFPGDLLASWFFPYKSGGWTGFSPWITHKEFIAADVVRQLYPWRTLAIDMIKNGSIPLWNPYAFSGTPLLANLQSSVFYPLNILFFFFSYPIGWIIYVLLQPVLAFIFMYFFIRSLKLSKYAAVFSGIAFGFIGYFAIWFEWGVVGHTALWLPLSLFGINKYLENKKNIFLLVSSCALTLSFFGGHAQTAAYVWLICFIYYFSLSFSSDISIKKIFLHSWFFLLGFTLSAIQLFPTIELFLYSARNSPESTDVFHAFQLNFERILTLFVPDFFGNPASGNLWRRDYGEFTIYVGIVALIFVFIALVHEWKNKIVRLFLILAIFALLFALPTFLSEFLLFLKIPVLSTSAPSRSLFIFEFSLVIISAFGIEHILKKNHLSKLPFLLLLPVYLCIWIFVYIASFIFPNMSFIPFLSVIKRNLYLPSFIFLLTFLLIFLMKKKPLLRVFVFLAVLVLMSFEYQYFLYKYSPFSPMSYFFPTTAFVLYLQKTSIPDRVFGYDTARLDTNLPTQWKILSPEGYDPLYIRRYGELMYGSYSKKVNSIPRSDAVFENSPANKDSDKKQKLMNLLGVKFVVTKDDLLTDEWRPNDFEFQAKKYDFILQKNVWQVYKNKESFPRAAIFYNYVVINNANAIINTFFQKDFSYRTTIILEEKPKQLIQGESQEIIPARIKNYLPNRVDIDVETKKSGMLFLSDTFYPGWKAYIDQKETKIYRADYAFRAVFMEAGKHTVTFVYQPLSFTIGLVTSGISVVIFFIIFLYSVRKTKNH